MKTEVFIVSHTHWDREWYKTKSTFQMLLVDMMERLLGILAERDDFSAFLLDGQMLALEDYLAVCPQRKDEIYAHIQSGRLLVGPWYVLPDEYLASGEAHIRNYMEGMRLAGPSGTSIGYLPDSFGHPSQIPQILHGLGMREIVFWRGTGPEIRNAEFFWEGRDGSRILALNMAFGYSNAACLPEDPALRRQRLDHEVDKLEHLSGLNLVLLMNGTDHVAPDARVADWVREYQAQHPEWTVRHATLKDYVAEAHRRAANAPLETHRGELRSGYRAYLLGDTLSTRISLKQKQRAAEVMVENQLEPALTMLDMVGLLRYPGAQMRHLWKLLLKNLPHDSICGCSIDEVHAEMHMRYEQLRQTGGYLLEKAAQSLSAAPGEWGDGVVTVFHSQLGRLKDRVEVDVLSVAHPLRYVDYQQDQRLLEFSGEDLPFPTGVVLRSEDGVEIPGQVLSNQMTDTTELNLMTQPVMNRCLLTRIAFLAEVEGIGYRQYAYRFAYDPVAPQETGGQSAQLENAWYRLRGNGKGGLDIYCKERGIWYRDQNTLIDVADAGDEYTFDPLPGDPGVQMDPSSIREERQGDSLLIQGVLRLPRQLAPDRTRRDVETVDCAVSIRARLPEGCQRIEITTTVSNQAQDHRLCALFPLSSRAEACLCDSTFSLEEREIVRDGEQEKYAGWMEKPNNSFFQKNFTSLRGQDAGLAVMVKGLPHMQIWQDAKKDAMQLTLLRCVGWLSRPDLRSRNGNGGWSVATPGAQEPGLHRFEYALYPHANPPGHVLHRQALAFTQGLFAWQTSRKRAALQPARVFARLEDSRIFVSAFKRAEDGKDWVLRLINLSPDTVRTSLALPQLARLCACQAGLEESAREHLPTAGNQATVQFAPWEILTLRLAPENG